MSLLTPEQCEFLHDPAQSDSVKLRYFAIIKRVADITRSKKPGMELA